MVLVCAPTHRFAKQGRVSLAEVAGEPIIGFDSNLTIRREIDRALYEHRSDLRVVMEFDNIETIKRAIEIDAGVALLPAPTVVREVETGTLAAVPLSTDKLVRPLGIIHRRGKDLGVTVRRFVELLRSDAIPRAAQPNDKAPLVHPMHVNGNGESAATEEGNGHSKSGTEVAGKRLAQPTAAG